MEMFMFFFLCGMLFAHLLALAARHYYRRKS